jgi:hypothetical protein
VFSLGAVALALDSVSRSAHDRSAPFKISGTREFRDHPLYIDKNIILTPFTSRTVILSYFYLVAVVTLSPDYDRITNIYQIHSACHAVGVEPEEHESEQSNMAATTIDPSMLELVE